MPSLERAQWLLVLRRGLREAITASQVGDDWATTCGDGGDERRDKGQDMDTF